MPFRDIIGHRHLLRLLSRSAAGGTLPPSLIFAGPEGVGKRKTAAALGQALNCLSPVAGEFPLDACGECAACRRIARGLYPDVLLVEPEPSGAIKIEPIRDVVSQTAYRPFEGRRRVIVIDEADAMGTDSQDALLKSLEEPPPHSVFVLVSARADALLPTVRSRCSRLRFGRLSPSEIARALARDHGYTDEQSRAAAALAGGSLGRALGAASGEFDQLRADVCQMLRRVALADDDVRGKLVCAAELAGRRAAGSTAATEREALAERLAVVLALFRDLAILSSRAHGDALANLDLTSELQGLSGLYERDRIVRAFTAADRALSALRRNASPKIVADWLALQI